MCNVLCAAVLASSSTRLRTTGFQIQPSGKRFRAPSEVDPARLGLITAAQTQIRHISPTCWLHRGLPQLKLPLVLHSGAGPAGRLRARLHIGTLWYEQMRLWLLIKILRRSLMEEGGAWWEQPALSLVCRNYPDWQRGSFGGYELACSRLLTPLISTCSSRSSTGVGLQQRLLRQDDPRALPGKFQVQLGRTGSRPVVQLARHHGVSTLGHMKNWLANS